MATVGLAASGEGTRVARRRRRQVATDVAFEEVQSLDRELARVGRFSGSIRLAMGFGLEALARTSGHLDLGSRR